MPRRRTKHKSHKKRRTRRYKKRNLSKSKKRKPIKKRRRRSKRRTRRRRRVMKGGCGGLTGQQVTGVPMNQVVAQYPQPSSSPHNLTQSGGSLRGLAEFFGLGDASLVTENIMGAPGKMLKTLNGAEHPLSNDPTVHHNLDTGTKVGDYVPDLGEIQGSAVKQATAL
tara:strand:- start:332 stop:832 length:501 start_codon:yes stop_codon:yes gene_type:complete